jgi:polyferredoxin
MEQIKEICKKWRDNKCVHCGAQMKFIDDIFKCPNCVWNDTEYSNAHAALLQIGEKIGAIFCLTGTVGK